jgi:hypothetical protein
MNKPINLGLAALLCVLAIWTLLSPGQMVWSVLYGLAAGMAVMAAFRRYVLGYIIMVVTLCLLWIGWLSPEVAAWLDSGGLANVFHPQGHAARGMVMLVVILTQATYYLYCWRYSAPAKG